jgi:hypothetical protein
MGLQLLLNMVRSRVLSVARSRFSAWLSTAFGRSAAVRMECMDAGCCRMFSDFFCMQDVGVIEVDCGP